MPQRGSRQGSRGAGRLLATVLGLALALPAGAAAQDGGAGTVAAWRHAGDARFVPAGPAPPDGAGPAEIDLRQIRHGHDPAANPDVPLFTDVTLPGITPRLRDAAGRDYALITLYNIDPPLEDLPSAEPGIDRGMDYRDPSNLMQGVYSNYVSPVFTDDAARLPVAGHPIGHFYVRVEVPGHPPVLTGMTTTAAADRELVELTVGAELGLGGVLLTRQPGRLNAAVEAMQELSLRQRPLRVVDGRHYRREKGVSVGPTYRIEDGNVVFLRLRVPLANGQDAMAAFAEFVARGQQDRFGSLLSRPGRGSGAGCSAFAMSWLKATGVIPFVDEGPGFAALAGTAEPPFWAGFRREVVLPWAHVGCDARVGLAGPPQPAAYTVFDLLFHDTSAEEIRSASPGVARMVREDLGAVAGTLFQYGALSPLRGLVIRTARRDPADTGDYAWAAPGEGLAVAFWDNASFSDWVKATWRRDDLPAGWALVREGRFRGVEIDAMDTPRQAEPFFAVADAMAARRAGWAAAGAAPASCREVFEAFPPD